MNLEAIEAVRTRYHTELKARYQDYKQRLITQQIYLEEKAELDNRLQLAEALYQEYQASADQKILSDQAITHGSLISTVVGMNQRRVWCRWSA